MLNTALALQVPITAHCASQTLDLSMYDIALTADDWKRFHDLKGIFEIFDKPTKLLHGSIYPTLNYALPTYLKIMNKLDAVRDKSGWKSTIGLACEAAYEKLDWYYTLASGDQPGHGSSHSSIATICDPRLNLRSFNQLWSSDKQAERQNRARSQFHAACNRYKHCADTMEVSLPSHNTSRVPATAEEGDFDDDFYITSQRSSEPEWKRDLGARNRTAL